MNPKHEYINRLEKRRTLISKLKSRDEVIANLRLALFVVGCVIALLAFGKGLLNPLWILAPVICFIILLIFHDNTLRKKSRAEASVHFYERGIGRLEDRWAGTGITGNDLIPEDHLYAEDLDLFGKGSLFELLCTAQTGTGENTLAKWLCEPASPNEIRERQEAVEELRNRLDLREEIALLGSDMRSGVCPKLLSEWATAEPFLKSGGIRIAAQILAILAVASLSCWMFFGYGMFLFANIFLIELVFMRFIHVKLMKVLSAVDEPQRELNVLARILKRIDQEPCNSTKLVELNEALQADNGNAARNIAKLNKILDWVDACHNMLFALVAIVLMLPVHLAYSVERWRIKYGRHVPQWLEAVGEFEALCALASYAYERPEDPFPEIAEEGPLYDGKDLGHPLINDKDCVRNKMSLNTEQSLLIVSGSNMSGKSTLLRTVGINAVLALAGAPVRAKSLRISPLVIGATLSIHDSIQSGTSRFYAEITRLHRLIKLTDDSLPVLFLIDELLHGTNSHDRRVGGMAVLKGLIEKGSIGLATTHDLAIAESIEDLGDHVKNVHFCDHLEGDRLVFDYLLHDGIVKKSNALELMRAIGLKV